jgi:hypothetical protein
MGRIDDNGDAPWLQDGVEGVGDRSREPLLNLQTPGKSIDQTRQLRDPDHVLLGEIADVSMADDRRDVVLAMGFERNRPQQHDLSKPPTSSNVR